MAALPTANAAIVPADKIIGYLLDPSHRIGGPKAAFLMSFGFSAVDHVALAGACTRQ